ncbi:unnamed protein product, partial [Ectocarpus fasciculatus]
YVVGYTSPGLLQESQEDFVAYRLSSAWGEVVWKWQGGSSLHAELRGAVSVDDGHGVVVVGD